MRHIKALFGAVLALVLAGCSSPQILLNPFSNPTTTQVRQSISAGVDTTMLQPLVWGSFLSPATGEFFKPVLPTDSRNAVIYVYRPQSDWNDQEIQSPGFFLNGKFLSGLKSGSYFWFEVPSGTYYFSAKRPLTFFYLTTIFETDANFEGGKSYYFRYDEERPGPKKAARGAALLVVGPLQQMPDAQGRLEVAQARAMGAGSMLLADEQPQWSPFDFYANAYPVPAARLDAGSNMPRVLKSQEEEMQAQRASEQLDQEQDEPPVVKKRWWNLARSR